MVHKPIEVESASPGRRLRPMFVDQIEEIAGRRNVSAEWLSDYWVCNLSGSGLVEQSIVGGYFPINNAASSQLANDKVATFTLLQSRGVAAVPHYLYRPQGKSGGESLTTVQDRWHLPLVLKPNLESGGIDVYRAESKDELSIALVDLSPRYSAMAIAPYLLIDREIRCVVLNGAIRFAYEKIRPEVNSSGVAEWRHNLRLGSIPRLLNLSAEGHVTNLALAACEVMDLHFATVDVIMVASEVSVLEVNSSVTLDRFSAISPHYWALACATYEDAIYSYIGVASA